MREFVSQNLLPECGLRQSNPMEADLPERITPITEDWLDVSGAAAEINAGSRTIRTAIHRGELRACAINGRGDIRVHRTWLMDWLNARAERG